MAGIAEPKRRPSLRQVEITRYGSQPGDSPADTAGDVVAATNDFVATEEPLEIRIEFDRPDGSREERSISVTMRTPGHDEELALGFLYSEGIVREASDVVLARPCGPPAPNTRDLFNVVLVELAAGVAVDIDRLNRHFYTSSSCGVCGKASLEAVAVQGRFDVGANDFAVNSAGLGRIPESLLSVQAVFEQTGGLHAAALFDTNGSLFAVREDVGRHNALDKLIGSRFRAGALPIDRYGIALSGRASFELMQKAMMAGCPVVAAVGAPSSLAIDLAEEFGITLIGFLRRDRFNVYSRAERIIDQVR